MIQTFTHFKKTRSPTIGSPEKRTHRQPHIAHSSTEDSSCAHPPIHLRHMTCKSQRSSMNNLDEMVINHTRDRCSATSITPRHQVVASCSNVAECRLANAFLSGTSISAEGIDGSRHYVQILVAVGLSKRLLGHKAPHMHRGRTLPTQTNSRDSPLSDHRGVVRQASVVLCKGSCFVKGKSYETRDRVLPCFV